MRRIMAKIKRFTGGGRRAPAAGGRRPPRGGAGPKTKTPGGILNKVPGVGRGRGRRGI